MEEEKIIIEGLVGYYGFFLISWIIYFIFNIDVSLMMWFAIGVMALFGIALKWLLEDIFKVEKALSLPFIMIAMFIGLAFGVLIWTTIILGILL